MRQVILQLLTVSLLLQQSVAFAASETGLARVQILPAINISQQTEIDFGNLQNVNGVCVMSAGGSLSGSAGMDCSGNETPGAFTISGANGAVVNVSVLQGVEGGVTFTPVVSGAPSRTLEEGSATVTVLGSVELNNASEGEKNISYTFTANYE